MNPKLTLLLLTGTILGACSGNSSTDEVAGGGFETSDLQVGIVTESGAQAVGARAWLMDNRPSGQDSVDVSVDSATVDGRGKAVFPQSALDRGPLGIEAWSGDTLAGFHPRQNLKGKDTFTIVLRRTRLLTLPCTAFTPGTVLRVPGSHFEQRLPTGCSDTFNIVVPPSASVLLAFPPGPAGGPPEPVHFQPDTLPVFRPWGAPRPGYGPPPNGLDSAVFFPPPPGGR